MLSAMDASECKELLIKIAIITLEAAAEHDVQAGLNSNVEIIESREFTNKGRN